MRIAFINQRFPPYRSATGFHGLRLATYLHSRGHEIHLIGTRGDQSNIESQEKLTHHWIRSFYSGKSLFLRLIFSLLDSFRLLSKVKSYKVDCYIVMSDPPFLQLLATYMLPSAKTTFWLMDLYPEAFVSKGLLKNQSIVTRWYKNRLHSYQPYLALTLGDQQKNYVESIYKYPSYISSPIGLQLAERDRKDQPPPWYKNDNKVYFGYIGNLGEAHDVQFLKKFIGALDSDRHQMILSCQGSKAKELLRFCKGHRFVTIIENPDLNELKYLDIHLVTLAQRWTHTCVPSKALLAVELGAAVIFNGSKNSDSWHYIRDAGWAIKSALDQDHDIKLLLDSLNQESINEKKNNAHAIAEKLKKELNRSYSLIAQKLEESQ